MASEDAVYRESSQYRLWSFSPGQLADLRAQTNALAQESIRAAYARDGIAGSGSGSGSGAGSGSGSGSGAGTPTAGALDCLTPAEERLLLDFYTVELLRAGKFTEQPTDVQATAAVFFRRFYVTHSLLTYPPAALYKTALFFGAKAEGYYHKLDGFALKFPHTTAADVLAGEFLLCQGIRFAFDVRHPFRGLEGAIMELRRLADEAAAAAAAAPNNDAPARLDDDRIAAAHRRAREILKFSPLITDAYFHFSPSQIMLAALRMADAPLVDRLLDASFHRLPDAAPPTTATATAAKKKKAADPAADWERIGGAAVRARVEAAIADCAAMLATERPERFTEYWGQAESNSLIKPLLKKLKACHNPDRWDLVALQQAKREGAVKAYHQKAAEEDGAVFGKGGPLPAPDVSTPDLLHDAKRRKVAQPLVDPFGPPL